MACVGGAITGKVDINHVTHRQWDSLTAQEKEAKLLALVISVLDE